MSTAIRSGEESSVRSGWYYSAEEVFEIASEVDQAAEERGRRIGSEEGLAGTLDIIQRVADQNRDRVMIATQDIIKRVNEMGFRSERAFLRHNSPIDFEIIIAVRGSDFVKDEFDSAIQVASAIRAEVDEERISLDVMYMPVGKSVDRMALIADGYTWWYEPQS